MTGGIDFVSLTLSYLNKNRDLGAHEFEYRNMRFLVFANVFSPLIFEDTAFFADNMIVRNGERLLEVGCGSGVISTIAALQGAAEVFATDINPAAIANTNANSKLHGVSKIVRAEVSDLFTAVPRSKRFDTIFWNAPFIEAEVPAGDPLALSVFDPGYGQLHRYIENATSYLERNGRLLLGFSSTSGNRAKLERMVYEARRQLVLLASTILSDETCEKFSLELYSIDPIEHTPE